MAATARSPRATAKPKAPPKRPPALPSAAGDDDEVIDLSAGPEAEPERIPVFRIGDTVHTMLKNPPLTVVMSALELAERRGGTPQAIGFADVDIMRQMLGTESYRALLDCKTITRDQYLKIVGRVMKRALGAAEDDSSPNR